MTFASVSETLEQKSWRGPARGVYLSLRIEKILEELLPQILPSMASKIKMYSYREGRLSLFVSSPALSQEIYLNSAMIIKRLNELLGGKAVEEIKLKISNH